MRTFFGKNDRKADDNHTGGDSVRYSLYCRRSPKIIAVAGGKGGVGKSIFASMLGMCLAGFKRRTVLVDLDFSGANLHGLLDLPESNKSLNAFLSGRNKSLSEVVQRTPFEKLDAITFQSDPSQSEELEPWQEQKLFHYLKQLRADYIILDLGNAATNFGLNALLFAGNRVIITSADMFSVLNTFTLIRSVVLWGVQKYLDDSPSARRTLNESGLLINSRAAKPLHVYLKQIQGISRTRIDAMQHFLRHFSPAIVLNCMRPEEQLTDFALLGPLANDLLSIRLDFWGGIRYDASVRAAVRESRPSRLLSGNSIASEDMVKLAVRNLLAQEIAPRKDKQGEWIENSNHLCAFDKKSQRVTCHNKCLAWNSCHARDEGGPCTRMVFRQMKKVG